MRTYDVTGGENCFSNRRGTRSWEGVFRGASEEEGQGMVHMISVNRFLLNMYGSL